MCFCYGGIATSYAVDYLSGEVIPLEKFRADLVPVVPVRCERRARKSLSRQKSLFYKKKATNRYHCLLLTGNNRGYGKIPIAI